MGLSSLSSIVRSDEVVHALAKVKSVIPAERAKEIASALGLIAIEMNSIVAFIGTRLEKVGIIKDFKI